MRIVSSGVLILAIVADVWYKLFPLGYPWCHFFLGPFTWIAFSGLAFTRARRRQPVHLKAIA